jgi:transcription-repair coupling factor (superfamily II helicase)
VEAARRRGKGPVLFVAADENEAEAALAAMAFFAPGCRCCPFRPGIAFPMTASRPSPTSKARRLATLAALAKGDAGLRHRHDSSTRVLQRVPPRAAIAKASFQARQANEVDRDELIRFLAANGYARAGTVRDPGDFALRGGIVDLWPPGTDEPLRLDFFGETLEAIRKASTRRRNCLDRQVESIALLPASEAPLERSPRSAASAPAMSPRSVRRRRSAL